MSFRIVACLMASAAMGLAGTIDFNSISSSGNPDQAPSLTTSGFTFSSTHFHSVDNPSCSFGGCVSNGTIYLSVDGPLLGQPITMAAVGGGAFSLSAIDASMLWLDSGAAAAGGYPNGDHINLLGNLQGGGTLNASFALGSSFATFNLPGSWNNLASVVFSASVVGGTNDASFALDNIVVNAVPEPGTWGALAAGLCALAVLRRRLCR